MKRRIAHQTLLLLCAGLVAGSGACLDLTRRPCTADGQCERSRGEVCRLPEGRCVLSLPPDAGTELPDLAGPDSGGQDSGHPDAGADLGPADSGPSPDAGGPPRDAATEPDLTRREDAGEGPDLADHGPPPDLRPDLPPDPADLQPDVAPVCPAGDRDGDGLCDGEDPCPDSVGPLRPLLPECPAGMAGIVAGPGLQGLSEARRALAEELCRDDLGLDCAAHPAVARSFVSEQPLHTVCLSAFCIDRREVSTGEYRSCVEAGRCTPTGCAEAECAGGCNLRPDLSREQHPVNCVNFSQAQAYCRWRGEQLGVPLTLPTEAQWERAAAGSEGRLFPWGETDPGPEAPAALANCTHCRGAVSGEVATTPVGQYPPGATPEGVLDLAGNVSEWTRDCLDTDLYLARAGRIVVDPTGPVCPRDGEGAPREADQGLVIRGGSYLEPRYLVRNSTRLSWPPSAAQASLTATPRIGFRCVY